MIIYKMAVHECATPVWLLYAIYPMFLSICYIWCPHLFFQIKSYARVHGQTNENDKGYVSISYYEDSVTDLYKGSRFSTYAHLYRVVVLCAFLFLNVLTPIALAKLASLYYPTIRAKSTTGELIGFLYWATAIMAFLCNTLYSVTSIRHHIIRSKPAITACIIYPKCSIPSDTDIYKDEMVTLVAVITIIPCAVLIELFISICIVKSIYQRTSRYSCSWKQLVLQIVDVFTLWNIFIMLQISTMVAIPFCVLLLIHPQVTVMWLISVLLIGLTLSLAAAYLLFNCQQSRRRKICCSARHCGQKFLKLFVMIAILGLIIALFTLYELLLTVQVQFEIGLKGIIISLLPSFPLSVLGWYIKRRSQMKAKKYLQEDGLQPLTETQETANITDTNIDEEPLPL